MMRGCLIFLVLLSCGIVTKAQTAGSHYEEGIRLLSLNDNKGALKSFSAAINADSSFYVAYTNRAKVRYNLKDYLGAMRDLNQAVTLRPNGYDVYIARANMFSKLKKYTEAYDDYSKALELNPNMIEIVYQRALVAKRLGDYEHAIRDIDAALRIDPVNDTLFALRAFLRTGAYNPGTQKGKELLQEAIVDLNSAIKYDSTNAAYFDQRGECKFELYRSLEALADFNTAIELDSANAEFYNNRGLVKMQIEDYRSANRDFSTAIKLSPDKEYYFRNRGLTRFNGGKYKAAVSDYSKAISMIEAGMSNLHDKGTNFKLTNAYIVRGLAHISMKNNYAACMDFEKAVTLGETKAKNYVQQYCAHGQ